MTGASPPVLPAKDPFYDVKERMSNVTAQLSLDFDQWKEALTKTNTHKNPKFKTLTQSVKMGLKALIPDIRDLEDTIGIVTANRDKFKEITDTELVTRRKFIADTRAFIQEVQSTFTSQKTKAKIERDQSEALVRSEQASREEKQARSDASDFIAGKQADRMVLEEKQDVVLDDMHAALERLGAMGEDIRTEMDISNQQLAGLEKDIEDADTMMKVAIKKMEKLLGTSDSGRLCCIFILFATAVALFFVIVSG